MKTVKCSALDPAGCDFEATGENVENIRNQIYNHAMANHADILMTMNREKLEELNVKIDKLVAEQE